MRRFAVGMGKLTSAGAVLARIRVIQFQGMSDITQTQSGASDTKPNPSQDVPSKLCSICRGHFPLTYFSAHKYNKDHASNHCKECHAQKYRIYRREKYNAKSYSDKDDSIIRSVRANNELIIAQAIQSSHNFTCYAFDLSTYRDYKVILGPSQVNGLSCICIFSTDGNMLRELSYSGELKNIGIEIFNFIKGLNLRLELTEADSIASKTTIYFL